MWLMKGLENETTRTFFSTTPSSAWIKEASLEIRKP